MEAKDIPADMMAQIRKKFEEEPKVQGLRTQQFLFQQKKDYNAALAIGKVIEVLFGTVVQAYLDEVNAETEEIDFKDLEIPVADKEKISILNVTLFMAIDIAESCLLDINDVLHKTDKTLNYEIHDDLKELAAVIRDKMKYWGDNSEYLKDNAWGDKCDDMYEMMKNKAKSIIRKRKSDKWGKNFEKYKK
ncbi:MAG: hypothetical protein IJ640_10595 [Prevotella sp.]|nr:hypothetical protein [Prevotella sp.]